MNLRDADGRPTLYILALENNVTIAKYLMENSNINVNLPDNEGRTPLHVSSWQGHLEMVELLVSQGTLSPPPLVENDEKSFFSKKSS